ncbi:negative regulator of protein K48-linked deubiquitination [Malassezia pachydermatis]
MTERESLLDMGFDAQRVDWALQSTDGSLTAALDHLEAHQDEPMPAQTDQSSEEASAKSIQCNVCHKLFRDMDLAMYHAEKSGHEDFSESQEAIRPLSEEEKKQRLEEMRAKLAQKRAAKEQEEARERKANELIRRKAGQDAGQAREELERKERIKEAEKKRRERLEEIAAKERVRQQIEEDKRRRAEKAAHEKALRQGLVTDATSQPAPPTPLAAQWPKTSSATETRLRVRTPTGTWMGTMHVTATLRDLEQAVVADGKGNGTPTLTFSTTFPRKSYTEAEKNQSLKELGLVPNAALEAQ